MSPRAVLAVAFLAGLAACTTVNGAGFQSHWRPFVGGSIDAVLREHGGPSERVAMANGHLLLQWNLPGQADSATAARGACASAGGAYGSSVNGGPNYAGQSVSRWQFSCVVRLEVDAQSLVVLGFSYSGNGCNAAAEEARPVHVVQQ